MTNEQQLMKLAGILTENADYLSIFNALDFKPTTKKRIKYLKHSDVNGSTFDEMPALSYATVIEPFDVETTTADGKETQNKAEVGDVLMSGPSAEKYVLKPAKFKKMYDVKNDIAVPEQSDRMTARYDGTTSFTFPAPWGEQMVIKPGDYVIKEGPGKFYRIAKKEYTQTYN
jgi:hypothetical protein